MVSDFKFFDDNNESIFLDDDSPSWVYETLFLPSPDVPYEVVTTEHRGIREFLSMFPNRSIQVVRKISGWCDADGFIREHDGTIEHGDGWGFDIVQDRITIQWLRFNPEQNENNNNQG